MQWPGCARYWEAVQWTNLNKAERKATQTDLEARFRRTQLGQRHSFATFEILDSTALRLI